MSIRYLYEFDYLGSSTFRMVEGASLQALNYTWRGVSQIEELDLYLNIIDSGSGTRFSDWLATRGIDKVFLTKYKYDTESQTATEITRQLYTNVSSDSENTTLRKCDIPETQLEDAQRLVGDGIVQLYEIKLNNGTVLHLKQDNSVSWNGYDWLGIPILFEGYSTAQADSYSRPTLSIANPDYVNANDGNARSSYSNLVLPREGYPYGLLNRAEVTRYLVLYEDLIADKPIYQKKQWIIWFIKSINRNVIQVELRNRMDGVNFDVPARMYIPPEFPFVTLR